MTRARYVLKLVLSAGLAVLVLGALGVSSASAATAPAIKVCKLVPVGIEKKGLWNSPTCGSENVKEGKYAWAWADNNGKATIYCALIAGGFTESLCESGTSGPFSEFLLGDEEFPKLLGLLLLSILTGSVAKVATEIDCKDGDFHGTGATGSLTIETTITYLGCLASKPANCEVSNVGGTGGTLKTEPLDGKLESLTLTNFSPENAQGLFIKIEYKEGCGAALKGQVFPVSGSQMCEFGSAATTPAVEQLLNCTKKGSALKLGTEPATYEGLTHIKFEGLPYWKVR
jgi:hypothetical protein